MGMRKTTLNIIYATVLGLFVFSNSLLAQDAVDLIDMSLDELLNIEVTTASKKAERIVDAPGIVSVITENDIKSYGAVTLADVLDRAPSLQLIGSHLYRDNVAVVRGDLLSHGDIHVLVMINGRPVREGVTGGINSPVYTSFPVEMISRIEIVRGPGSVLYGTNAFAGVINIITKDATEDPSLSVTVTGGSFGTTNASATASMKKGDLSVIVGTQVRSSEGWDFSAMTVHPSPANADMQIDKKYSEDKIGVSTGITYKNLKLSAFYSNFSEDTMGGLPYATFDTKNNMDRLFLDLGYTHTLIEGWDAAVNLTHNSSRYALNDEHDTIAPDEHESYDYIGEVSVSGAINENLNMVAGASFDSRNKNDVPLNAGFTDTYHLMNLSAYTQFDYKPMESLKLIAGAQLNKPDGGDADVVPRLGAIYNFTPSLGAKALYGQAFRSAVPMELLLDVAVLHGNEDLGPEKIATTDLQVFYTASKAEYSLTYFRSNYSDLVTRTPYAPGVLTFANSDEEMTVDGFEFETKASVLPSLFVTGSAMYQDNKDDMTYAPSTMVKFGATYTSPYGVKLSLFNSYFGASKANDGAKLNGEAEAVNMLSLNAIYRLPVSLPVEFSVYAKNLLDVDYNYTEFARGWVDTLPIGPGRSVYASVNVKL